MGCFSTKTQSNPKSKLTTYWAQASSKERNLSLTDKPGLLGVVLSSDARNLPKNDRVTFLRKFTKLRPRAWAFKANLFATKIGSMSFKLDQNSIKAFRYIQNIFRHNIELPLKLFTFDPLLGVKSAGHQMGCFNTKSSNQKLTNQCNGLRNWAQATVGTVVKGN